MKFDQTTQLLVFLFEDPEVTPEEFKNDRREIVLLVTKAGGRVLLPETTDKTIECVFKSFNEAAQLHETLLHYLDEHSKTDFFVVVDLKSTLDLEMGFDLSDLQKAVQSFAKDPAIRLNFIEEDEGVTALDVVTISPEGMLNIAGFAYDSDGEFFLMLGAVERPYVEGEEPRESRESQKEYKN